MKINNRVEVASPVDDVWALLEDVPRVASCMPGANLTEIKDENTFNGTVAVKIGPIAMNYHGTVVIERRDPDKRVIMLNASGKDRRGAGSARANVTARLVPVAGDRTELAVESDVQLSGRVASLGRGVQEVTTKLFGEFAERLSAEAAKARSRPEPVPAGGDTSGRNTSGGTSAQATGEPEAKGEPEGRSPATAAATPAKPGGTRDGAVGGPAGGQANAPIKAGGLLWSILKDKLAALVRRLRRAR